MCVFCSIANHEIPTKFLYEDDRLMVFADIKPSAPVHYLVVPKEHIPSLAHLTGDRQELLGALLDQARIVADQAGVAQSGYKVVINTGSDGGQMVEHLHVHVLGGAPLANHV